MTENLSHEQDQARADLEKGLSKMIDVFFEHCPNDPDFLEDEDSEEVVEQMESIQARIDEYHQSKDQDTAISLTEQLISFNQEWLPDSIEEDEIKELQYEIDSAQASLNVFRMFK